VSAQLPIQFTPPPADVRAGTHPAWQQHQPTSREGAESVRPTLADRQAAVLATIRARGGCTIHEIATRLRVPDGTASARVRELTLQGRIRDGGTRRKNPHSGVRAIVWVAA
jgi:DNA-binding MarR family transcriptional regulator